MASTLATDPSDVWAITTSPGTPQLPPRSQGPRARRITDRVRNDTADRIVCVPNTAGPDAEELRVLGHRRRDNRNGRDYRNCSAALDERQDGHRCNLLRYRIHVLYRYPPIGAIDDRLETKSCDALETADALRAGWRRSGPWSCCTAGRSSGTRGGRIFRHLRKVSMLLCRTRAALEKAISPRKFRTSPNMSTPYRTA